MSGNGRLLPINKKDIKNLKQSLADQTSSQIQQYWDDLRSLLELAESQDQSIDWADSREPINDEFTVPDRPEELEYLDEPSTPSRRNYEPAISLLDHLIPSRKHRKANGAVE